MGKKKFKRYDHSDGFFQPSKGPKGPVRWFLELWLSRVLQLSQERLWLFRVLPL